ncbi:MAG: SHOCT domain-containing protein [Acidimicrobiia bacterium]
MGLFKDAKDALKGAKELGDYHGGTPSVEGSVQDIKAVTDDRGQNEILENGTPAKAVALGFALPSATEKFAMQIELEIHPSNGEPYTVTYVYPSARQKAALSAGMEVPVKISANDPMQVAVQWDALKGSIAASGGEMNAVMQGLQNTYAGTADAAGRAYLAGREAGQAEGGAARAPAPVDANDPAERMKKLTQMRDAGLINAVEFESKKAEILADL